MRINHLVVENFKGFEHREFSFHPQVNLLVGENGSGKTSVLDALAVAAGGWLSGFPGYDSRHIKPTEVRLKPVEISVGPANGRGAPQARWDFPQQFPCVVRADGDVMGKQITWERTLNSTGGHTTHIGAKQIRTVATRALTSVQAGEGVVLPLISYYGTGRLWDNPYARKQKRVIPRKPTGSRRLSAYKSSVDPRIPVARLVEWIDEQQYIGYQQGFEPFALASVRESILGCVENARSIRFDAIRREMIVEIEGQGAKPFDMLSDGQRTLLSVVFDIAQKATELNPALGDQVLRETPGIVMIDELDLHLHPIWQRRVIEDLRTTFPRIQFIFTTHSPFLIQSLRSEEELVMLDGGDPPNPSSNTLATIAESIMHVPHPQVGQRYWDKRDVARQYLEAIANAPVGPSEKLALFEEELANSIAVYADDPAYQAFLEMNRIAKLGK